MKHLKALLAAGCVVEMWMDGPTYAILIDRAGHTANYYGATLAVALKRAIEDDEEGWTGGGA